MNTKFAVVHNLETLTEPQRLQYLRDASVFLGLDPDLNGLDIIWLNTNEGPSRLTAYARRGTTDILRRIHGISVLSLEQHDGPGYVSFKATGKNGTDRQEIAIGAYATEGLKGDRLAAAVATAQTRALRRLTLQFVGLAVLDESEVSAFTQSATGAPSQLALAPPSSVAPSNVAGRDITIEPKKVGAYQDFAQPSNPDGSLPYSPSAEEIAEELRKNDEKGKLEEQRLQQEFEARQAKLRADAIASLNESSRRQEMGIEPTHANPVIEVAQNTLKEGVSLQEVAPKKTRKPRSPNKPKVDLGPSEPPKVTAVVPELEQPRIQTTVFPIPQADTQSQTPAIIATLGPRADGPTVTKPRLTPDQVKPFRQRLFRVVNDYLEPHGFAPKEGMGNADKMRGFAQMMFSDVTNMNELTIEQWEKYLTVLESKIKAEGPAATVKYIEESIGI